MNAPETKTIRTMCPMSCHPTFCGMLATVEDGKLVEIKGDKENPDSQGFLCVRGQAAHEIIANPKRILHPLIRKQRGADEWRQASWDEALDLIAERMQAVGRERGRNYSPLFDGLDPEIESVELTGKGIYHRLYAVSLPSQSAARQFCQQLKQRGGWCSISIPGPAILAGMF